MIPYENFSFFAFMLVPLIPAVLMGLLGVPGRIRACWLLLSTLLMLWLVYQPLTAIVQVISFFLWGYILVRGFLAFRQSEKAKDAKTLQRVYFFAVLASILPLALVKLNPYFSTLGIWNTPIGFLGISYLTFRTTGTVIEIRDGLIKEVKFLDFILFILFFPTLASGPIDRYRRFVEDLNKPAARREYVGYIGAGVDLLFRGLLYKFIIAYLINQYAMAPLSQTPGLVATIKYMYVYSFYLFFDFAGYSAFAIGTSYLLGIKTPQNFNKPFLSKNIKDFWNRWHMSLSFWFRDYIYMRFVLDSAKKKRFKNRYTSAYIGYLLLFGIMGIWHGTQLRYIAYGFYHAALMIGFDWLDRQNKTKHFWGEGWAWNALATVVTAHCVFFGFLIFSGRLG
jgi:membrane protein involved in D-alanine export